MILSGFLLWSWFRPNICYYCCPLKVKTISGDSFMSETCCHHFLTQLVNVGENSTLSLGRRSFETIDVVA